MVNEQTEETQEAQGEIPTLEEQFKSLQEQVTQVTKERDEAKKGLSTAHSRLTEKDKEIKRQTDIGGRFDEIEERIKLLAAAQASRIDVSEDSLDSMSQDKKQDLLKVYEKLEVEQKEKRQQADLKARQQDVESQALEYQKRVEALGLAEDDEQYWEIHDMVVSGTLGGFKRADIRLKKMEATQKPKETKTESEEEVKERVRQEVLEEEGLLKTESAVPSGRTKSQDDATRKYAEGEISRAEYEKATGR